MSSKSKQGRREEETLQLSRGMWGWLAGLITLVVIAFPLSAAVAYATHPATRTLFGDRLSSASAVGFSIFWWILALLLIALPFLVGFGVAKLSSRWLTILGVIVVILVVGLVILGQMFAF
jgi:Na+/H+-dicarboxylate symporter